MYQNNVVYNTSFGCGNLNITAKYSIENLVVTKKGVNTHTHTFSPPIPRAIIYSLSTNPQSSVKAILQGLSYMYPQFMGYDSFYISVFRAYIFHLMMFTLPLCSELQFIVKKICVAITDLERDVLPQYSII